MRTVIYLVGQMSAHKRTYEWRENFIRIMNERQENGDRVQIINPFSSKFDRDLFRESDGDTEKFGEKAAKTRHVGLLVPKDRNCVRRADIIIANVTHYSPERYIIGSFFELAWAFDQPATMVVGICENDLRFDPIATYPFVQEAVHTWVKNEAKAAKVIQEFLDTF